jgi:hypothetical protein
MRALPRPGRGTRVVVGGLALAIVSELGQAVPMIGRDPGVEDVLADSAGVCAAVGLMAYLDRPERRRVRRPEAGTADGAA